MAKWGSNNSKHSNKWINLWSKKLRVPRAGSINEKIDMNFVPSARAIPHVPALGLKNSINKNSESRGQHAGGQGLEKNWEPYFARPSYSLIGLRPSLKFFLSIFRSSLLIFYNYKIKNYKIKNYKNINVILRDLIFNI